MMEMKEQTGSRKKLLVPVVVLMLCLVTLTGAAYAYTSTMTNTANTVTADYLSIDLKGKGATAESIEDDIVLATDSVIQFQDHFEYAGTPASKTNLVTYTLADNFVAVTYHIRVESDVAGPVNLVVSSSNLANVKLFTYNTTTTKLLDKYNATFTVSGTTTVEQTKTVFTSGSVDTVNTASVAVNEDLVVAITFDLKDVAYAGPIDIGERGAVGTVAKDYADAFVAASNNMFALTFTAEYPTA